jgi:hypothetical protein
MRSSVPKPRGEEKQPSNDAYPREHPQGENEGDSEMENHNRKRGPKKEPGKNIHLQKKDCRTYTQHVKSERTTKFAMKTKVLNLGLTLILIVVVHGSFALIGGQISLNAEDIGSCDPPEDPTTGPGSE